ncbi:MAG: hypothetical protein VKI82_05560 [Leptolyngbya sp.]|nr:hypothetical protein [Leptolyngbya sp.]
MSDCPEPASRPSMAELLLLPEHDRNLVLWIQRQHRCPLDKIQVFLQQSRATTLQHLRRLQDQGYLEAIPDTGNNPTYRARFAPQQLPQQRSTLSWVLEDAGEDSSPSLD